MKRMLSLLLVFAVTLATVGVVPVMTAVAAGNTAAPTDLKVDLRENPYGLETLDPTFSWVMNDPDKNEKQTAYRVVISATAALSGEVLDSGWVSSNQNTGVHLSGIASQLKEYELYYWQVQTKDKDGNQSALSKAATFMTGIGGGWTSLNGIWPQPEAASEWSNYTVEQTMTIASGGAVAMLGYMDSTGKNGYMLQVRDTNNQVRVHRIVDGTIQTPQFATLNLSDYGVTLPTNGSAFGVKVNFSGATISFAFKTGSSYVNGGSVNVSSYGNRTTGTFGYRTGMQESGTIDDVTVTANNGGEVLYSFGFGSNDGRFPGMTVADGKLTVDKRTYSCFAHDANRNVANYAFFRSPLLGIDRDSVDKAVIHLATRGSAADRGMIGDLYFNGYSVGVGSARDVEKVGSFAGKTNYTKVFYNSYDVTEMVKNGNNVIGVLGNSLETNRGILVQMTLFKKDGSKQILTNSGAQNSGWKMLDGTAAFGDRGATIETGYVSLLHDNVDMNHYPTDWSTVGYNDSAWKPATTNGAVAEHTSGTSGRVLTPYCSENTLRVQTNQPTAKIVRTMNDTIVVDLGKEIIGGVKVDFDSPEATSVTVRMGEQRNLDGSVKYKLSAGPIYEDMWTLVKGTNVFETATMRNFRYVELVGLSEAMLQAFVAQQNSVSGWAMMQPFDESDSAFEATDGSDAATLLNRLYELSKYTIKATNQDVYVDSQARERAPYEGDLLVNANTSYSVSDNYSLARHSNEWLIDNPTWPNDYSLFIVEMVYLDYLYTGDKESAVAYYDALKKKLTTKVASKDSATGLIQANNSQAGTTALIDWPMSERDGYQGSTYDVVFNSEYVGIYKMMANLATALGKTADAAEYNRLSDQLKASLLKYAYNATDGCFYDSLSSSFTPTQHCSTHATAYALCYGVYDSQAMADKMASFVYGKCEKQFVGSVYFTYFILKGLYNSGHGDKAEALMTIPTVGTNLKTFATLLDDLQCTITPEAWGIQWKSNMTFSHPWGAAPGCSIVQGMFGINPTSAGFHTFDVKLQPGGVKSAGVVTATVQGKIGVTYTATDKAFTAKVNIPANTTARVYLPSTDTAHKLFVDGTETAATRQGEWLMVTLGSGNYTLVASATAPASTDDSDEQAADKVIALIDAIPRPVTLADKQTVEAAAAAYDALTPTQQLLVTNADLLADAKETLADLIAADRVETQINALPSVITLNNGEEIAAARKAYDALTDSQQKAVTNLAKLQQAEQDYRALTGDDGTAAVQSVIDKINALPQTVTYEHKDIIDDARAAYNGLSSDLQARVTNLAKLVAAEQAYEQVLADKAVAEKVVARINALPEPTIKLHRAVIEQARAEYEALSDFQKGFVTNLEKLERVEKALAELLKPDCLYGDVDASGKPDSNDALTVLKSVVGKVTLTAAQTTAADVNGDKTVNAADALLILQFVVGKIQKFPVEQ